MKIENAWIFEAEDILYIDTFEEMYLVEKNMNCLDLLYRNNVIITDCNNDKYKIYYDIDHIDETNWCDSRIIITNVEKID